LLLSEDLALEALEIGGDGIFDLETTAFGVSAFLGD